MKLTADNLYLVSAAEDRFIYVWKCKSFYDQKKKQQQQSTSNAPAFSLPMDDTVIAMDVQSVTMELTPEEMAYLKQIQSANSKKGRGKKGKKEKNGKNGKKQKELKIKSTKTVYYIAGCSKSAVYIWRYDPIAVHEQIKSEGNDFQLTPSSKITVARRAKGTSADILDLSRFRHIQFIDRRRVMVLRGTQMMPVVKAVTFLNEEDTPSFISRIEVEHVNAAGALSGGNVDLASNVDTALKRVDADEHMTVLHVADRSRPSPKMFDHQTPSENVDDVEMKQRKKEKKRKRTEDDDSKFEDKGPAAKRQRKKESESVTFQDKLFEIEKRSEMVLKNGAAKIPDANSLYTILTQSLKSNV